MRKSLTSSEFKNNFNILGISCFYHDSAIAVVDSNKIIFAIQEERISRKKGDQKFPKLAIKTFLRSEMYVPIDKIIFYEKPYRKFFRITGQLATRRNKKIQSIIIFLQWIFLKLHQKIYIYLYVNGLLFQNGKKLIRFRDIYFSDHHLSHLASSYYTSGIKDCIGIVFDGIGEFACTSVYECKENSIKLIKQINFPNSLGLFYATFTQFLGFRVNSGEYKLMGLAPYGDAILVDKILENLITLYQDGSYKLNMKYFNFSDDGPMFTPEFSKLFQIPPRKNDSKIFTEVELNLAASCQRALEIVINNLICGISNSPSRNLVLAGGVALNCVNNSKILEKNLFEKIHIQAAAGDAGGALGAAFLLSNLLNNSKVDYDMKSCNFGNSYSLNIIENSLNNYGINYRKLQSQDLFKVIAKELSEGKIIGVLQGRSEFGPRALGFRSILADPRNSKMQEKLNLATKFRESFRPFAPVVKLEEQCNYFEMPAELFPHMLFTFPVKKELRNHNNFNSKDIYGMVTEKRSIIPACTHIDYSCRVQSVSKESNYYLWQILDEFQNLTGLPILINTSFNVRGEPIVESPSDAIECFIRSNIDLLVLENILIYKRENVDIKSQKSVKYILD